MRRLAVWLFAGGLIAGFLIGFPLASKADARQCDNRIVNMLKTAGFKGHSVRVAYAIVMRESKGVNLSESSPWYTGALGVWQIQTSAHSGKSWWSRAAMLNPARQTRIVYLHMTNKGRWWQPWGITPDGKGVDATQFPWSSWQIQNWIWAPYIKYYREFPKGC